MGGIGLKPQSTGMKLIALAAGYLLADMINPEIDKILPKKKDAAGVETPNQTIGTVGQVGIGGLLLMRKKQTLLTVGGGGILAGAGLKRALKQMGVIKGYQSVPVIGRHRMAGYQSTPVIAGRPMQLTGTPPQLSGYTVNGYNSQGSGVMGAVGSVGRRYAGAGDGSGSGRLGAAALVG